MRYKLKCKCGATQWVNGGYPEPDTNATELDDPDPKEWTDGAFGCTHEDYEVSDYAERSDEDDYPFTVDTHPYDDPDL